MTPDREALIHAIELRENIAKRDHHGFVDFTYEMVGDVLVLLKKQPKIVLCRDCKWFEMPRFGERGFCRLLDITTGTVWFCADGEEKHE